MLATVRPNAYMESFEYGKHHSDYKSIAREDRIRQSTQHHAGPNTTQQRQLQHQAQPQPQPQPQQQLPPFRDVSPYTISLSTSSPVQIVPPAFHSAIECAGEAGAQNSSTGEQGPPTTTRNQRTSGSGLPSPIFSQSSSMPDSLDELGHRNYESLSYPQSRSNSIWSSNTNYSNEMATSYQRQPFYPQSFGAQKQFSGLPPMRDAPADSMYTSGGAYSMYNGSPQAPTPVDHPFGRRASNYGGSLSATYPGADRNYPSMEGGFKSPYAQSYQQPRHSSSFTYQDSYGAGYGSMSGGMPYPPMGDDGRGKRRRGNLPKHTTDLLRSWLAQHIDHPYPTEEEKQILMSQTGLNLNQVRHTTPCTRRCS